MVKAVVSIALEEERNNKSDYLYFMTEIPKNSGESEVLTRVSNFIIYNRNWIRLRS